MKLSSTNVRGSSARKTSASALRWAVVQRHASAAIGLNCLESDDPRGCRVVIAHNRHEAARSQAIDALHRRWAVAHDVAKGDDSIYRRLSLRVGEHGVEGRNVRMDIADNECAHGL